MSSWIPQGEVARIADRAINGMVYVGSPQASYSGDQLDECRPFINPRAKVASSGSDPGGQEMGYWPGYSTIQPVCRATYLDWLATGKADNTYDVGYMFLYFYGLERRFFLDTPSEQERGEIVREAERLRDLYGHNNSARRYLGIFLDVAQLLLGGQAPVKPMLRKSSWSLPLSVKLGIAALIEERKPLTWDWLLSWLINSPDGRFRTPATRCPQEFGELFRLRFESEYPQGLSVDKPKATLEYCYEAASQDFTRTLEINRHGSPVADIGGLRKPLKIAQMLADSAMDDLAKYSTYLLRNPQGRESIEGHSLLPAELRNRIPNKEIEQLSHWARAQIDNGGLVPLETLVERLNGSCPAKIGRRDLACAADALARLGYGMAPDPRFALRAPKPGEPVVVFDLGKAVDKLEDVSDQYRKALMTTALGSFVAHADGDYHKDEDRALVEGASSYPGLNDHERRRLLANIKWMAAVPPDMALLRRRIKGASHEELGKVRASVVMMAVADSRVQTKEVAAIEKIYKALGVDTRLAHSDLMAVQTYEKQAFEQRAEPSQAAQAPSGEPIPGSAPIAAGETVADSAAREGLAASSPRVERAADAPVLVRRAEQAPAGESIPEEPIAEPGPASGFKLDMALIEKTKRDTERSASILGNVFNTGDASEEEKPSHATRLEGLAAQYADLTCILIDKELWTEEEFTALAKEKGMFVDGAVENINEWARERYDDPLLDQYDGFHVDANIAQMVKNELTEEV